MLLKRCRTCDQEKPLEEFHPHKQCRGGFDTSCKLCRNAQRNAWKRKNSIRLAAKRRERYSAEFGAKAKEQQRIRAERYPYRIAAENLMAGVRERSAKIGVACSPEFRTKRWIEEWLRATPNCPCCQKPFHVGPKNGVKNDASPSFDRLKPALGYVIGNVALICWRCNNIKRNYGSADLSLVAAWMRSLGL